MACREMGYEAKMNAYEETEGDMESQHSESSEWRAHTVGQGGHGMVSANDAPGIVVGTGDWVASRTEIELGSRWGD